MPKKPNHHLSHIVEFSAYNCTKRKDEAMSSLLSMLQLWLDFPALIGYLKGQAFSKPLTAEQEQLVIARYLTGDEQARLELIEKNMRLVAHVIKKFHPPHELLDDYISIGTIGLMKAVESYTPSKKTKLSTYAARCIENEILMHLRSQKKTNKDISIFEPISTDKEGHSLQIRDLLPLDEKPHDELLAQNERTAYLYTFLEHLNERELEILTLRYGLGGSDIYTQKEIAAKLGISRSYVSRIEKRALIKLYQCFKKENQ